MVCEGYATLVLFIILVTITISKQQVKKQFIKSNFVKLPLFLLSSSTFSINPAIRYDPTTVLCDLTFYFKAWKHISNYMYVYLYNN